MPQTQIAAAVKRPPPTEDDTRYAELLAELPEQWASVPAEDDGFAVASAFIRAAYGRGYVTALETEPRP